MYVFDLFIYLIYLLYIYTQLYTRHWTYLHTLVYTYASIHMFIYALQYSTTAYTGLIPVVAIPMNQPVFHKISGCHWHAIGYGGHRPLRLLRLSRL